MVSYLARRFRPPLLFLKRDLRLNQGAAPTGGPLIKSERSDDAVGRRLSEKPAPAAESRTPLDDIQRSVAQAAPGTAVPLKLNQGAARRGAALIKFELSP